MSARGFAVEVGIAVDAVAFAGVNGLPNRLPESAKSAETRQLKLWRKQIFEANRTYRS
jgi:hypothetical protein